MAVLHGALDVGDEWRIVKNKDTSDIKPAERAFLMNFEKTSASGSLICAMGGINHYTINHMTGQGKLQGFALKVAKALNLEYPREQSAAAKDKRDNTTKMLYAAAHPVSKRNMAYTLDLKPA